jgi:hypothetical protein
VRLRGLFHIPMVVFFLHGQIVGAGTPAPASQRRSVTMISIALSACVKLTHDPEMLAGGGACQPPPDAGIVAPQQYHCGETSS